MMERLMDNPTQRENDAVGWHVPDGADFRCPSSFLSGQGDVPSAARAMREGALDYLVKPGL